MTYELCTDRAAIDLTTLQNLLARGYADWDDTDKELWTGEYQIFQASDDEYEASDGQILVVGTVNGVPTNRGAWNYTDCNRIRETLLDLYDRALALGLAPEWPYSMIEEQTATSVPGSYGMTYNLLANLKYIRDFFGLSSTLPSSLSKMSLVTANRLEQCLLDVDEHLEIREAGAKERYAGEMYADEEF